MKLIAHPPKLDLPTFMGRLKEFAELVHINEPAKTEILCMANNFAFSLIFFSKYNEFWAEYMPYDANVKEFGWILFVITRINLL